MPKFNKKIEVKNVGSVACIGRLDIGRNVRYSQTGSGLAMIALFGQPNPDTDGISAMVNLMFQPRWLDADFDPADLAIDSVTAARARTRVKRALDAKTEPDADDLADKKRASEYFVYQRNISGQGRPALLQLLLGSEAFDEFCLKVDDATPEEFLTLLKAQAQAANEEAIFIYECRQQKDQDGELRDRMEISAIYRIENAGDLEHWANSARSRDVAPTFNVEDIEG